MGSIKNVLLVGASGFLGSHLLTGLIKNGYAVTILKRNNSNLWRIKDVLDKVKVYNYDLTTDPGSIYTENNIDCVVNTATEYGSGKDLAAIVESNILLPVKLLDAAQKQNLKLFINTDSFFTKNVNEYDHLNQYTSSKKILRSLMENYKDLSIANVQLEHVFGENDSNEKFVPKIINSLINNTVQIDLTSGLQKRDFIYVGDVVDAYITLIKNYQLINGLANYELGTGKATSIREFVEQAHYYAGSVSKLNFGALPTRKGEFTESIANNKFNNDFNWSANTPLATALIKIINYQKASA